MQRWRVSSSSLVLQCLLVICTLTQAKTVNDASNDEKIFDLLELGTKYNRLVRPPPDYNTTNTVYLNFVVLKLLGLDEVEQHMSLEGFIEMEWNDRRLAWFEKFNSTFDHVEWIYLPRTAIWIPDVIAINAAEHSDAKMLRTQFNIISSTGRIFTSSQFGTKTLCDINLLYFPFDSQTCKVVFGSWLMLESDLELKISDNTTSAVVTDTDRQTAIESDEYCITKSQFVVTPQSAAGNNQEAVFTISIQRKPLFFVVNLIIPSFLMMMISIFSFFLPPESADRLSLNITLMLSLMVFMQIVAGYTPAQSDSVPMLTRFFAAVVAVTALSTVGSVFQQYCHVRGNASKTLENAAVRFIFLPSCLPCGGRTKHGGDEGKMAVTLGPQAAEETGGDSGEAESLNGKPVQPASGDESEWHIVGRRLDNCLFVVMVIATSALALLIAFIRNPDYVNC